MEPMPSMAKAYSLVLQVEKQKEVTINREFGIYQVEEKNQTSLRKPQIKRNLLVKEFDI